MLNRSIAILAVIVITCVLAAIPALVTGGWFEEIRDPRLRPSDLVSRVRALSGPNARACGIFEYKRRESQAFPICVSEAFASGSAFWVVAHGQGVDSIVWSGVARNSQGKVWTVLLDTDVTGTRGPPDRPVMSVTRCAHPSVRERRLDCENWHRYD
jgi:hypothetical protein